MRRLLDLSRAVPWWILSIGLHAFVLAVMALHYTYFSERPPSGCPVPLVPQEERILLVCERTPVTADRIAIPEPPSDDLPPAEFPGCDPNAPAGVTCGDGVVFDDPAKSRLFLAVPWSPLGPELSFMGRKSRRSGVMGIAVTPEFGGTARGGSALGGTAFRGRLPGHHGGGATTETERAMLAGLRWLARHQADDGRWAADQFGHECHGARCPGIGDGDNDPAMTGLALLAFLGAGYTHQSRDTYVDRITGKKICVGEVVKNGLKWLLAHQDAAGRFVSARFQTYNTSIATTAVAEAFGLTKAEIFRESAQRGIDYVLQSQNPYYGWRYTKRPEDNDTSNLGFAMMALHSGDMAGLVGIQTGYKGARKWLDDVTEGEYGYVGYQTRGDAGSVRFPETASWQLHRSMTAVGAMGRVFMDGAPTHPSVPTGAAILATDPPEWAPKKIDYYYWYYGTLAEYLADAPKGRSWRTWNDAMVKALVPHQHGEKDGCLDGSWDVDVDRTSIKGAGRVYATALNTMTLEVYYRFPLAFGVRK